MKTDKGALSGMIDSTLLEQDLSENAIRHLCDDAVTHKFHAVCVPPEYVKRTFSLVIDTSIRVVSVVSFPHGTDSTYLKCRQAERLIKDGADEIDMVMNLEWFLNGEYQKAFEDILNTVIAAKSVNCRRFLTDVAVVKVIVETALLRQEERKNNFTEGYLVQKAGKLVAKSQADFVKTSTGKHPAGGVRTNDVALLKSVIPDTVKVKAAGGIRSWKHVEQLLQEGVDRFGTSKAVEIVMDFDRVLNT